ESARPACNRMPSASAHGTRARAHRRGRHEDPRGRGARAGAAGSRGEAARAVPRARTNAVLSAASAPVRRARAAAGTRDRFDRIHSRALPQEVARASEVVRLLVSRNFSTYIFRPLQRPVLLARMLPRMDCMAHFDAASCADYVRGTLGPKQHRAMERHVVRCRSCAATVGWLREIAEAAAIDQESEPPAHLLR